MKKMHIRFLAYLMLLISMINNAMQTCDAERFVSSAGSGNIPGLKVGIKYCSPNTLNANGSSALSFAAGKGQLESVQFLLNNNANPNIQDQKTLLTPLHWAVMRLNKDKPTRDYLEIINLLLEKGADIAARDRNGLTVLHEAARGGNDDIIKLLLQRGAAPFINDKGALNKGRTPLAEALRASKNALIHIYELEEKDIYDRQEFNRALERGVEILKKKEKEKLNSLELIKIIKLLMQAGARTDLLDAFGLSLEEYLDETELATDAEREELLTALKLPFNKRYVSYSPDDLTNLIKDVQTKLNENIPAELKPKLQMLLWTLQAAQQEQDPNKKYDILRVGLTFIPKMRRIYTTLPDKDREYNQAKYSVIQLARKIRDVLINTALVVSQKAQPTLGATPASAVKLAPQTTSLPDKAPTPAATQAPGEFQIDYVINFSNQPATLLINAKSPLEYSIPPSQGVNATVLAINQSAGIYKPTIVTSFKHKKSHRVIPANLNVIEVFFAGETKISPLNISEYKNSTFVIFSDGEILITPTEKAIEATKKTLKK